MNLDETDVALLRLLNEDAGGLHKAPLPIGFAGWKTKALSWDTARFSTRKNSVGP